MSITYNSYLKINQLLALQQEQSYGPEHDELLFIITHQVYELWFKQILHEVDHLCVLFNQGDRNRALHTLKRLAKILKTLTQQVDVLETLTPLEFNSFREALETASGFQSVQFRELEIALGNKSPEKKASPKASSVEKQRLEHRFQQSSLWDCFTQFIKQNGFQFDHGVESNQPNPQLQAILINIYRNDPLITEICEAMIDVDEGIQEWRYRHVKMVERTIGTKFGTGGSSGADYLRTTLFKPLWPDLWEIRAKL